MNDSEQILDRLIADFIGAINSNPSTSNYIFDEDDEHISTFKAAILQHYISKEDVEAAIGEDEDVLAIRAQGENKRAFEAAGKNDLRASIRKTLGLESSKFKVPTEGIFEETLTVNSKTVSRTVVKPTESHEDKK